MADIAEVWKRVLPEIKNSVTGVGVWTALNHSRALELEDGVLFVGLPTGSGDLSGHLKMPQIKRLIEQVVGREIGHSVVLRVIDGVAAEDIATVKRKDSEAKRLQEQQLAKMRAEMEARSSWESVYEQLSRRYAALPQKSLPQNRARFFEEAVELIAETRKSQTSWDELGERNFARCLERLSQYSEVPSTICAQVVLERAGEL